MDATPLNRGKASSRPGSAALPTTGSSKTPRGANRSATRAKTPGGSRTPAINVQPNTQVIAAVVEGRGIARGEIGVALMDLRRPEVLLCQFADSSSYVKCVSKLQIYQPIEIIVPSTTCDSATLTKLVSILSESFPNTSIVSVKRKYFNEEKGSGYLRKLCVSEYRSCELEVQSRYYCLAATAALLKYIEFIQNIVYASSSLKFTFQGPEQTLMIDTVTARHLELICNARNPASSAHLLGALDHTCSTAGARLLRAELLQPPCDVSTISVRQDCVQEFLSNEELFFDMEDVLSRFLDLDQLISLCIQIPKQESIRVAEFNIQNIIYLKHSLALVDPLRELLKDSRNPLMQAFSNCLSDPRFEIIRTTISEVITNETHFERGALDSRMQKCFAVKPQINGILDVARRTYSETVTDVTELVAQLAEKWQVNLSTLKLPLKLGFSPQRGYFIQMNLTNVQQQISLPRDCIQVIKNRKVLTFTTSDLLKMNDRIRESLQEIFLLTNQTISELLSNIRDQIGCLYKLTEAVAMLDMLRSFACVCTLASLKFVRPEFTDTLALRNARHPIFEIMNRLLPPETFLVPNNAYMTEGANFLVITGANMSGKSTYIRQIALLQIMAQIGAFVPADYASFKLMSQIFSRIGSDEVDANCSTFMSECQEISYILQNANDRSLVIIDELGRGTSTREGVALCLAIAETLAIRRAFTFFVTHFIELTQLESLYPNVENHFFQTNSITVLLKRIELSKHCALPHSVVERARTIACHFEDLEKGRQLQNQSLGEKERMIYKLATRLRQIQLNSTLEQSALRIYLKQLRLDFQRNL